MTGIFDDCAYPADCECAKRGYAFEIESCAVPRVREAAAMLGLDPERVVKGRRVTKHIAIILTTSGAAFENEGAEVSRILGLLAHDFRTGVDMAGKRLHDANGDECGEVKVLIVEGGGP